MIRAEAKAVSKAVIILLRGAENSLHCIPCVSPRLRPGLLVLDAHVCCFADKIGR